MLQVGATGPERLQAIDMLKKGASIDDVIRRFCNVEEEYFRRNEVELLEAAGFPAEKPKASKKG